jgi:hypothetical protein
MIGNPDRHRTDQDVSVFVRQGYSDRDTGRTRTHPYRGVRLSGCTVAPEGVRWCGFFQRKVVSKREGVAAIDLDPIYANAITNGLSAAPAPKFA